MLAIATDVSSADDVGQLAEERYAAFGDVSLLMNNAGVGNNPASRGRTVAGWQRLIGHQFLGRRARRRRPSRPRMLGAGKPGLIVNTGSKQGITTPPGNLAYNVSKAGAEDLHRRPGARTAQHAGRRGSPRIC